MMTRKHNGKATNRQHCRTDGKIKSINFGKFRFFGEWLDYIDRLSKEAQPGLMYYIFAYGFHETEPDELTPEAQEYFNRVIRPELDRQHKRLNEGKRI